MARMTGTERREQLLDTTLQIIARDGFAALSIDAVARAAGITRPVIYGHFTDLSGLLNALLDREQMRAISQLAETIPAAADDRPVLDIATDALRGWLEAVASTPLTWHLVLIPAEGAPRSLHERIERIRAQVRAQLAAVFAAGLAREGVDPETVDLELTAHIAQGASEHAARLVITEPDAYPVERIMALAEQAAGLVMATLRTRT
ncbi:MAG: TetR/AcrR family transcriptional regulator [Solirubrobacteraceae bacterium]|nr:TetR/AcrR family transcriptional regulator [Solirubrobacteraceae bacterium]